VILERLPCGDVFCENGHVLHFLPTHLFTEFFWLGVPKNRWNIGTLEQILTFLFINNDLPCSKILKTSFQNQNVPISPLGETLFKALAHARAHKNKTGIS